MRRLDRRTGRGRARTASPLEVQLPAGVSRSIRGRRKVVSSGRAVQAHGPIRDGVLHQVPGRTSRLVKHAEASATCAAAWALPRRRASQVHNPWCGGILAEVNVLEVGVRRLRHRGDCSACCVGKAFGQRQRLQAQQKASQAPPAVRRARSKWLGGHLRLRGRDSRRRPWREARRAWRFLLLCGLRGEHGRLGKFVG